MRIDRDGRVFLPYKHTCGGMRIAPDAVRHDQQIFSHYDLVEKVYRHFDVGCLQRMAEKAAPFAYPTLCVRLLAEDAEHVMRSHGIERPHLDRLPLKRLEVPGIMVTLLDGTTLLVDGNHRYVRRWMLGLKTMLFFRFTEAQARRSLLDIPDEISPSLVRQSLDEMPQRALTPVGS